MKKEQHPTDESLVYGRNPVMEALRSGRAADHLLVARGERTGSIGAIVARCRQVGIPVKEVAPQKLDFLTGHANHQGVALQCAAHEYGGYSHSRTEKQRTTLCGGL